MQSFFRSEAVKISVISVIVNLALALFKFLTGLLGHSQALIADAVHSASDVLSTLVVIVSLALSGREADDSHEYGHQKFESLAALILGLFLFQVGIRIGWQGIDTIRTGSYETLPIPSAFALVAALVSILVKEGMYRVTIRAAKRNHSPALKADAWHHRSDALSSVGSLVGVGFSLLGFPVMDAVAGILIAVFVLKSALEIVLDAGRVLTDSACDEKTEAELRKTALAVPGVLSVDLLRTRRFGAGYYVDLEVSVDSGLSLDAAHTIAESVHDEIENRFSAAFHCMVHVNPGGKKNVSLKDDATL